MKEIPINQIICGDCLDVMKDWPDKCVDLVVTSPPYDNLRDYKDYSFNFEGIAQQLYRVIKKGGVVVWVVGDMTVDGSETGTSFIQALHFKKIGFNLHDTMIYAKVGFRYPEKTRYNQQWEYMFIFSKDKPNTFNPLKGKRVGLVNRRTKASNREADGTLRIKEYYSNEYESTMGNVWVYDVGYMKSTTDKIAFVHPAIFPDLLAADHIKSWTNINDIVLDPMDGSGTTCVAAKMLCRRYIGIDISEQYCKIARDRLEAVDTGVPVKEARAGQKALFE